MLVSAFIRTIYVPTRISLSRRYVAAISEAANSWGLFIGRPAVLEDFSELAIASFLCSLAEKQPATSVNSYRRRLLSVWEGAYDAKMVTNRPDRRRIRTLPEELDPPEAWNESQVVNLMGWCRDLDGYVGDVLACDWWLSLFDSIYWTSNRITAMLAVPSACYDGAGILVRKQKNHRPQWFPIPESCREIIERTRPERRKLIWEHPWHPRTVWTKAREIIEAAGLPAPKTGRQLFHRLRRTTITLCAVVDPAVAQRTAGHKDYATTQKHYVDPRIVAARSAVDVLPDPLAEKHDPKNPPLLYQSSTPQFRIYG